MFYFCSIRYIFFEKNNFLYNRKSKRNLLVLFSGPWSVVCKNSKCHVGASRGQHELKVE